MFTLFSSMSLYVISHSAKSRLAPPNNLHYMYLHQRAQQEILPCIPPCLASSSALHGPRHSNAIHHTSRTPSPSPPMTLGPSNPRNPNPINITQQGFPASTQLTSRKNHKVQVLPLRHNVVPKTSPTLVGHPCPRRYMHSSPVTEQERRGCAAGFRVVRIMVSSICELATRQETWCSYRDLGRVTGGMDLRNQCPKN
jgi:hypothetical protein